MALIINLRVYPQVSRIPNKDKTKIISKQSASYICSKDSAPVETELFLGIRDNNESEPKPYDTGLYSCDLIHKKDNFNNLIFTFDSRTLRLIKTV